MTNQDLEDFYTLGLTIKAAETKRAAIRERLIGTHGTGQKTLGKWLLAINSFTVNRFNREAAEAELGDLSRFEKPTPSVRVDVKPTPAAMLEAME